MANIPPMYLLTGFSCCEDFEKFLLGQNHANRALLDTLTQNMVDEWNKKACNIAILGGNLCLLDKDGKTIASVPMLLQDGDTITRDPVTGKITCVKVNVMGLDKPVKMWMGSRSAYNALKTKSPDDTVYFFTDINLYDVYNLLNTFASWVTSVSSGTTVVPKAKHAEKATNADDAAYSVHSSYADGAGRALDADHAAAADSATNATKALNADNAANASRAAKADKATADADGNNITETYGNFKKDFVSVGDDQSVGGFYIAAGTYQVVIHYYEDSTFGKINLDVTGLVYFNGSNTVSQLLHIEPYNDSQSVLLAVKITPVSANRATIEARFARLGGGKVSAYETVSLGTMNKLYLRKIL